MTEAADPKLDAAFWKFHQDNPRVYELFVGFARQAKAAGASKIGAKAIWERIRWEAHVVIRGEFAWDLNNNYTSRYSRLVMKREPDLVGMFDTRKLKVKGGQLPLLTGC